MLEKHFCGNAGVDHQMLSSPSDQLAFTFLELKQKVKAQKNNNDRKVMRQVAVLNEQSILKAFIKMKTYSESPSSPHIYTLS